MIAPFGPKHGVASLGGMTFGSFTSRFIKGKDLFCSNTWSELNQKENRPAVEGDSHAMNLATALGLTAEEAKKIEGDGLGSVKQIEPGQVNT